MLSTAVLSCHFTQFLQYNHRPLLTTLFPSPLLWPSLQALVHNYTTLAFARPTIVTHTEDVALFFSNFSFKPLGGKRETNLAACSVIAKNYS